MIDFDRLVLYVGIASVLAVATFNHLHAHAAQPEPAPVERSERLAGPAGEAPSAGAKLPAAYWTDPATSPLQGVGLGLLRAADPLMHQGDVVVPTVGPSLAGTPVRTSIR